MNKQEINFDRLANKIRFKLIEMSNRAKAPHLGSALSCLDVLIVLYWKLLKINVTDPDHFLNDRFILSKGHAASALYAGLAYMGFFTVKELDDFAQKGKPLAEQPAPNCAPGV